MGNEQIEARFDRAAAVAELSGTRVERRAEALLRPGVPTFAEVDRVRLGGLRDYDAVFYGIPFEGFVVKDPRNFYPQGTAPAPGHDVYSRPGAYEAPTAIRQASLFYSIDHSNWLLPERGLVVGDHLRVGDLGDAPIGEQSPEEILEWLPGHISEITRAGAVPLIFGGDHSVSLPTIAGIFAATGKKLGVVTYDAHYDLSWYPRYWAGSQWARAMELGALDPANLVHLGIRGVRNSHFWHAAAAELGTTVLTIDDIERRGIEEVSVEARERALSGCDALYVSIDVDVFDPAALPAQKYPEVGGLTTREMLCSLRTVLGDGRELVGFDFSCLGPAYDHQHHGAAVAGRCYIEVLAALAAGRKG
ncbi:arginase family protein [Streptomyces sp. NPDC052042]|uniref:arginase family protein n=1 Tax=Streptomyces sp. NPDC052042 TaxID=3365683 RepID=UPI0037D390D1